MKKIYFILCAILLFGSKAFATQDLPEDGGTYVIYNYDNDFKHILKVNEDNPTAVQTLLWWNVSPEVWGSGDTDEARKNYILEHASDFYHFKLEAVTDAGGNPLENRFYIQTKGGYLSNSGEFNYSASIAPEATADTEKLYVEAKTATSADDLEEYVLIQSPRYFSEGKALGRFNDNGFSFDANADRTRAYWKLAKIPEYTVTLPSVTGATLAPVADGNTVFIARSFEFTLALEAGYDQSTVVVTATRAGGSPETLTLADGKYTITDVRTNVEVSVSGVEPNQSSSTLIWKGTASGDERNWGNAANWEPAQAPTLSSDVTIAKNANNNYPILTTATTVNSITFEAGAELGGQKHLTATEGATITYTISNGRWNLLSLPIAVDNLDPFYTEDNIGPASYFRRFTPSGGSAGWTYITNLNTSFGIGEPFAFYYYPTHEPFQITGQLASADVAKSLSYGSDTGSPFTLVGNPFMNSIDFSKLDDEIGSTFYIVNTDGYLAGWDSGLGASVGVAGLEDAIIAPLQSFIVENETEGHSLNFGIDHPTLHATGQGTLKAAAAPVNLLGITASNEAGSVRTVIAQRNEEKISHKLFNGVSNLPDIYTLSGSTPAIVNTVNTDNITIPLALSTSYAGEITFSFAGMDNYDAHIVWVDKAGETLDLSRLASKTYTFNYAPAIVDGKAVAAENRFEIQLTPAVSTGITNSDVASQVVVSAKNKTIRVTSPASDPIQQVSVYNAQGQLVSANSAINAASYTLNTNETGVYIVKVITAKGVNNVKLINK
ncbi:MAG: T9SS type A sorting domain-containing protein [Candidatus Symbiothrix sp.]|jgi:hypothetical protein|nr:T9SS type A sorting domain-containing protein [Candidatus Symbiothrix sp.]